MWFFVLVLLFGSAVSNAALDFQFVDGGDVGIEDVLIQHVANYGAATNGASPRLWSSLGWHDATGSYVYAGFHVVNRLNSPGGYIFRKNADGTYTDATPAPSPEGYFTPAGSQPTLMDINNDGLIDMISNDDECTRCTTILRNADGSWTYSPQYTLKVATRNEVRDIDGDGRLDIVTPTMDILNREEGFYIVSVSLADRLAPVNNTEVQARAEASYASDNLGTRFFNIHVYEIGGDQIVSWKGGYGSPGLAWTMIVRNGEIVFDEIGSPTIPKLIDGEPGFIFDNGTYQNVNGLYRRSQNGEYQKRIIPMERWSMGFNIGAGGYEWVIHPVDLDSDGDDDLVVDGQLFPTGWIMEQLPDGSFVTRYTIATANGHPLGVGDIDGDGDIDVTNTNQGDLTVGTRSNNQNSTDFGIWINQSSTTPSPVPNPDPVQPVDPFIAVNVALDAALGAVFDAQTCAVQMQAVCTQEAIDAAQAALITAEQSL